MNIVLIHYSAPPVVGGVETILARQAQQLAHAGHQVHILAGRGETWDARIPVETIARLDTRHPQVLKARAALENGQIPEGFQSAVEQMENDLRRWLTGCDVIIAHNLVSTGRNPLAVTALYNLTRAADSPRLILWHHDLAWSPSHPAENLYPGWPWDLVRAPWPDARHVAVSEALRQQVSTWFRLPAGQISVVPAGLDLPEFLNLHPRTVSLVDRLGLAQTAPLILTPVRITRRKNLDMAVEITASLRKKLPKAALLVTGPAGSRNAANQETFTRLKELRRSLKLHDAVFFLAELHPEGLPQFVVDDLYRLADVMLLPSREESFGFPILEAGLAGLPIFCSDLPALRALAGDSAHYFSPDEDPGRVAKMIESYLAADPLYRLKVRTRLEYTLGGIYRRHLAPLLGLPAEGESS